jgi:hypothetical protein
VSWEASRGAKSHKVLCADLDRHQVGYVDVEEGKSQVLIENVSGKYRLDIVAFNDHGASAPKQAFFDCSRSEVAKEELEAAFQEWDKFRAADPPVRVEKESKKHADEAHKRLGGDGGHDLGEFGKTRSFLSGQPHFVDHEFAKKAGVDNFYFTPLGRALQSPQAPYCGHRYDDNVPSRRQQRQRSPVVADRSMDDSYDASYSPRATPRTTPRTPTPQKARKEMFEDDNVSEIAVRRGKRGPFSPAPAYSSRYDEAPATPAKKKADDWGAEIGFRDAREARAEDREIAERLTSQLASAANGEVAEASKRSASPRQPPRFAEFLAHVAPEVPYVKPVRQLGWKGDGAAGALVMKTEVTEDVCTLRWGWRGSRNAGRGVNGYVVFVARLHERWEIAGRLQYGESAFTARHLPRNVKYHFVVFAYPINQKEEGLQGWLSQVTTVAVLPGMPAPPRNVTLGIEDEAVIAKWEHAKEDSSGETVVGYRIRGENTASGEEGALLCEVPAACSSLSWPMKRYTGGSQISVSTVTAHRVESERVFSKLSPVETVMQHAPIPVPTLSLAPDGSAAVLVHWQKRDPVTRYAILIKVRNKRRVQRFPVTASPAVCVLEAGVDVVAALEGDNLSTGPRVSGWSEPLSLPAAIPGPPGRPCVRQSGPDLTLSWASPLDCREEVSYIVVIESQDGRRAEIHAGFTTFWSVLLDELLLHFKKTKLRFSVVACGAAGRSAQSLWSPKVLFTPTAKWLLKEDEEQRKKAARGAAPRGFAEHLARHGSPNPSGHPGHFHTPQYAIKG